MRLQDGFVVNRKTRMASSKHYHMTMKLKNQRHWLSARNFIKKTYNVKVNFSGKHNNYCYEAFQYCIKSDKQYLLSEDHPDLTNAPRTSAVSTSKRQSKTMDKKQKTNANVGSML